MKAKIIIFILLNVLGFLLATLGTISVHIYLFNLNYFWPVAAIQVVGAILFGWTGIIAGTTFSFFANMTTAPTYTSVLCYIPANFLQSYLAFYLFRKFNYDINLKGIKSMLCFSLVGVISMLAGAGLASIILLCLGKLIVMEIFFRIIFIWLICTVPWIIIFGIPLIKIFAPILKEYGYLFGQPKINKPSISQHNNKNGRNSIKSLPIFLKISFSLLVVGVVPISVLGAYEIIMSKVSGTASNINAVFICFGFFGTLMLTGILTNAIISPIKKLSRGIDKITEGDFDHQIEAENDDELGKLAVAFNKMSKTVKENIRKASENEKLAVIGGLASTVAHDVRNPFKKIKLMLEMFPKLTSEQVKEYSEDMDMTIRKVEAMLSDITESAREREYELIPGNILCALDLAIKDVSRYRPKDSIDFYYDFDTVALVDLDEQRICRAFENIINNAFDFSPEKKGFMWFSAKEQTNEVKIIIGNGHSHIPEDKIQEIFKANFTSGKQKGTGLGLSIVDKVIRGHHGTVIARNVKKASGFVPEDIRNIHGVEFVITLPLADNPGYSLKDPLIKNSQEAKAGLGMTQRDSQFAGSSEIDSLINNLKAQAKKPSLLILDDESIYRMRVRGTLESLGSLNSYIHTIDASNYKEATELINHTKIDYLICDIDLGDKRNNGFDVLAEAIKKYPDCKVLVHTNRKEPKDIEQAKRLGACGFCSKPITEAILVDFLLKKELWPSDFKKEQLSEAKTDEYIEAVPNTNILIVNDDLIALELNLVMMNSLTSPKDNVQFHKAKDYQEAKDVIDEIKPNILIADYNLETKETGVDVCKYMKEKNNKSISVLYSGMTRNELEELKKQNKKWVDEVFSTSAAPGNILDTAFKLLKNHHTEAPVFAEAQQRTRSLSNGKEANDSEQTLINLISYTISILYGELNTITSQIEKAPDSLEDLEKFKSEFTSISERMTSIGNMHDAIIDYLENDSKVEAQYAANIKKIEQLLKLNNNNNTSEIRNPLSPRLQRTSPKSEILRAYLKILHVLRHDITSNITIVKNFIIGVEMFSENMGDKVREFALENVIKLQGINEAVTTIKNMVNNNTLKPDAKEIKLLVKNIIKESMNKILSMRNT